MRLPKKLKTGSILTALVIGHLEFRYVRDASPPFIGSCLFTLNADTRFLHRNINPTYVPCK